MQAGCLGGSYLLRPTISKAVSSMAAMDHRDSLLVDMERCGVRYFVDAADPRTGLVSDSAYADGTAVSNIASSAATGFGLTALCIGVQQGWIQQEAAAAQVRRALGSLLNVAQTEHGFYYHFMDKATCQRAWQCELSFIDTALLMAGVLTARAFFEDRDIKASATEIYERVDWPWSLNGGVSSSMGWSPEGGFMLQRWNQYCELMVLYLLGLGSPSHPLDPKCWQAWQRDPLIEYRGKHFIASPPLFTHQYSQAWFDFRGRSDAYADYWINSVLATEANREFCMDQGKQYPTYSETMWGATASNLVGGYNAWGGPPQSEFYPKPDGTVVPCAVAGSLPFDPANCTVTLQNMRERFGAKIWGPYGFCDAFNPMTGWSAPNVIGIDVGISVIMAENLRSGSVWNWFMANPEAGIAMRRAGFGPSPFQTGSRTSLIADLPVKQPSSTSLQEPPALNAAR